MATVVGAPDLVAQDALAMSRWVDGPAGCKVQRITLDGEPAVMMECPNGHRALLDDDMLHGRVSTNCYGTEQTEAGCSFHATYDFSTYLEEAS